MADDDLSAPLGQRPKKKRRFVLPVTVPQLIAGALTLCLSTVAGWALLVDDPFGGEPMVVVSLAGRDAPQAAKTNDDAATAAQKQPNAIVPTAVADLDKTGPGARTVTIIDGSTGKRADVQVGGAGRGRGGTPPHASRR